MKNFAAADALGTVRNANSLLTRTGLIGDNWRVMELVEASTLTFDTFVCLKKDVPHLTVTVSAFHVTPKGSA